MAMATYLHMVTDDKIASADANLVRQLDGAAWHQTYFAPSLSYFLTGSAYPSDEHPLSGALFGSRSVDCPTLENGSFGVVSASAVASIAQELAAVRLDEVKARIAAADLDRLIADEELEDLEVVEADTVPDLLTEEIRTLTAFYAQAAKANSGLLMYTT
jgi:hypothetical protein